MIFEGRCHDDGAPCSCNQGLWDGKDGGSRVRSTAKRLALDATEVDRSWILGAAA